MCGSETWLEATFGATLLGQSGNVDTKAVANNSDMVSLYFSAHWCPPCRGFTPTLAKVYKKVRGDDKKWDVIFVSSDRDQSSFDEYFQEMPWKAVPYANRELKAKLSKKFKVQGIPMLIHLDPKTGEILNTDGRTSVSSDQEGAKWPWINKPKTFWQIMEDVELLKKKEDGEETIKASALKENVDYIGIYFSAHWCPPCRGFTPKLNAWYQKNKDKMPAGKKMEFIFNSWDRDQESMTNYWGEKMDFLARPFTAESVKEDLDKLYEVQGIPSLVIVNAKTGETITTSARGKIDSDPDAAQFPWEKQSVSFMGPECIDALNGCPIVMAHTSPAKRDDIAAALKGEADKYAAKCKADGDWPGLMDVEFVVDDGSHELSGRVTGLIKKEETEVLYIMHLGGKGVFTLQGDDAVTTSDQINADSVAKLVTAYEENRSSLKKRALDL